MKFRIPHANKRLEHLHDITLPPWSKPMLPWEQPNTGMQKSPNQNHWSPNLSWMMIFCCKNLPTFNQKNINTHTNLLVPFRLCWPRTYHIIFFETKGTRIRKSVSAQQLGLVMSRATARAGLKRPPEILPETGRTNSIQQITTPLLWLN